MGDILRHNWTFYDIPRSVLGYNNTDFVWFNLATNDLKNDTIYVFATDSSEIYDARGLGKLQQCIKIPDIIYPPDAEIIVTAMNKNNQRVEFRGPLKRGATYNITHGMPGKHYLNGTISTGRCCPYSTPY